MNDETAKQLTRQLGEGVVELGKHKEAVRDLRLALGGAIQVLSAMRAEGVSLRTYSDETVAEVLRKASGTNLSTYLYDIRNLAEKIVRDEESKSKTEARLAQALDALRWLVSLDEPGNPERKTVTLNAIIERAASVLRREEER